MALVLAGLVAAMEPGAEDETHKGRVFLADDGTVAAVTKTGDPEPVGFTNASRIDVGTSVIYPGLVDLHSHLGYNTMPLWADPGRTTAYLHHDSWPGEPTYKSALSWPAWTLAEFAPESMLAYVQVRALAGGTTSIQGWPSASRPATNNLVRSVDNDQVGPLDDPVRVSSLTMKNEDLQKRAENLHDGRVFIYHTAEGQRGSIVTKEFDALDTTLCLQPGMSPYTRVRSMPAITTAGESPPRRLREGPPGPSSGLRSRTSGCTARPWTFRPHRRPASRSVWVQTGDPQVPGTCWASWKVGRFQSDANGWALTDHDLVQMVTSAPGDALGRGWQTALGRLVPGALGDVIVVARRDHDPWTNLVTAREREIQLVVVGGQPKWGTAALMAKAGVAATTTAVPIGGGSRRVPLVRPDDPTKKWTWTDVLARLNAVRTTGATERRPVQPEAARREQRRTGTPPWATHRARHRWSSSSTYPAARKPVPARRRRVRRSRSRRSNPCITTRPGSRRSGIVASTAGRWTAWPRHSSDRDESEQQG